jgi:hypothetical protein
VLKKGKNFMEIYGVAIDKYIHRRFGSFTERTKAKKKNYLAIDTA